MFIYGQHYDYSGFPGCGGNFTTDSGILISPNYPNAYHHNDQCIWTITIPPQDVMVFEITNLDLEDNDNCQYDFLEVSKDCTLLLVHSKYRR